MLFIPSRNSFSWHSVPSFQSDFYSHSHLEAFKTQRRGNALVDRTGHSEFRPAPQPLLDLSWANPGQGCTGSSRGVAEGPQQREKVIVAQPLLKTKILTLKIIKNESIAFISVSMMPAETVWSPSWEEAWLPGFSGRLPWLKGTKKDE